MNQKLQECTTKVSDFHLLDIKIEKGNDQIHSEASMYHQ